MLLILGVVNVDQVVAAYNYNAYKNNVLETIDVKTIYKLGDEGVPYLVKLMFDDDVDVTTSARNYIEQAIEYTYYDTDYDYETDTYVIYGRAYDKLENFGIYREKAYKALDEFISHNTETYIMEE